MRKRFNIILLTLLCLFCIMPDAMADTNYTANTTINIRAKADKSGKVLGKVQAGDIISVSSIEGDWAAIDFNGKTAYVSKEYITKVVVENHPKEKKKDTSTEDTIFLIVIFALIVGIVYGFYKLVRKLLSSAAAGAKKVSEIVEKQIDNSRQQAALQQETNELRKKLEDVKRNAQEEQAKKDADLEDVRKKAQAELAKKEAELEEAKKQQEPRVLTIKQTNMAKIFEDDYSIKYVIIKTKQETVEEVGRYEATRKAWKMKLENISQYPYALSVQDGIVKAVYKVDAWKSAAEVGVPDRVMFEGKPVDDAEITKKFVGKMIPECYRKKGQASPVLYQKREGEEDTEE